MGLCPVRVRKVASRNENVDPDKFQPGRKLAIGIVTQDSHETRSHCQSKLGHLANDTAKLPRIIAGRQEMAQRSAQILTCLPSCLKLLNLS